MNTPTAIPSIGGPTALNNTPRPDPGVAPEDARHEASPGSTGAQRLVLTVTEAAEVLGISRAFAYELVARGELPSIHLGRRVVIPRVQLLAFVGLGPDGTLAAPDPAA